MPVKWMLFLIFIWFFGMIMGSIFQQKSLEDYRVRGYNLSDTEEGATAQMTLNYLLDFSGTEKETSMGKVYWKLATPGYWFTWFGVLTLDYPFLKELDKEQNPETPGLDYHETIQSYFFKLLGIIGLLCILLMFIDVIQGLIPHT